MIYTSFQGKQLSMLGLGAMRLPILDGKIDEKQTAEMIQMALEQGINYFDTAYPYHGGESERVLGRILNQYPRERWYLATKYPGHQICSSYDPAAVFEEQLEKCGVDYFDFYLLHNVYENSMDTYLDPKWGILSYFKEQKRLGRIRHLGFSCHADADVMEKFLDIAGEDMEFCQIQLNYLDWTLQNAKEKVALLNRRRIPIWVMEPVRGGKLCSLPEPQAKKLCALRPDESIPAWGFRFLQGIEGIGMILSGMSDLSQLQDNLATFRESKPLNAREQAAILEIAEGLKDSVPCTGCRYCTPHCPQGLDIPTLISLYNELRFAPSTNTAMHIEFLPEERKPSACIGCGACAAICPQGIDIPGALKDLCRLLEGIPKWAEISRAREEAAKKLAAKRTEK